MRVTIEQLHQHVLDLWGTENGIEWDAHGLGGKAEPKKGTIRIPRLEPRPHTLSPCTRSGISDAITRAIWTMSQPRTLCARFWLANGGRGNGRETTR